MPPNPRMPDSFEVTVNGRAVRVPRGASAAAALILAGLDSCRVSVRGEPRAAFCGMGICFECRAMVDGIAQVKTCQLQCRPGMVIRADAG